MVAATSATRRIETPSPLDIRRNAARVRAHWSEEERRRRSSLAKVYRLLLIESIGESLCHSAVPADGDE